MLYLYYLIILSGIVMAVSSLIEKRILKSEHATAYTAAFSLVTAIMALVFIPFTNFRISLVDLGLVYAVSFFSTITYILTARVYKHGNISIASPLFSSVPQLLIVIFAFILLGERLSTIQYISIGIIVAAVYLMMFRSGSKQGGFTDKKYIYYLVLDMALMAVAGVLMKYTLYTVQPFTYLVLAEFFIAANMTVYMSIRYGGVREIGQNLSRYKVPILAISALTIAYRATYYFALAGTYVSLASPLRNGADVLITVVGGGLLFGESSMGKKLALSAVMLAAIYLLVA
ncbi:MAG: DMT family transporter [Candidatus Marsarchaeota archaeon]|nr:DMT family transporter [Candidatus Marsarchaeota archaeon]MCL5430903.1 DMT family transporter [Candidatus Marsarchaeota archaeon]